MADEEDQQDDLDLKPADAGALFRAEMWATNTLLGYWPYLVGVLVAILLAFLFYGQYSSYVTRSQREASAALADAVSDLPVPISYLGVQQANGRLELEASELEKTADDLRAKAESATGPARAEGLLKAAEIYRVAGATDKRRTALEDAASGARSPYLRFSAEGGLAALELEQDQGDAAVNRLRQFMDAEDGFFGQQAALQLGRTLEQLDRIDEAMQVYEDFLRRWPDSTSIDEVNQRRDRVRG